jgi:hypothetical protein
MVTETLNPKNLPTAKVSTFDHMDVLSGHKANHSLSSTAEFKFGGGIPPLPKISSPHN